MSDNEIEVVATKIEDKVPEIDLFMGLESNEGLQELMQKTELVGDNPHREKRFLGLAEKAKWVGAAAELTYLMSDRSQAEKPQSPYVLGISNWLDATNTYGVMTAGQSWPDAYKDLGIGITEDQHTDKFMSNITNTGKDIVFFLPPELYSNKNGHVTRDEMEWLMSHPDKAENVHLVFGGYDFINEEWYREHVFDYNADSRPKHLAKSFQKWIDVMFEGTSAHTPKRSNL